MAEVGKIGGPRSLVVSGPGLAASLRLISEIRNPRAFRLQVEAQFGSLSDARRGLTPLIFRSSIAEEVELGRDIVSRLIPDPITGLLAANARVRDRVFSEITEGKLSLAGEELTAVQDVLEAFSKQAAFRVQARAALDVLFPKPVAKQPEAAKAEVPDAARLPLAMLTDEISRVTDQLSDVLLAWTELKKTVGQFRTVAEVEKQGIDELLDVIPGLESSTVINEQVTEVDNRLGSVSLRAFELVEAGWAVKKTIDPSSKASGLSFKPLQASTSLLPTAIMDAFNVLEGKLISARDQMAGIVKTWESNRQPVEQYLEKLEKASAKLKALNLGTDAVRLAARDRDIAKIESLRVQVLNGFGEAQKKVSDVINAADQLAGEINGEMRERDDIQVDVEPPAAPAAPAFMAPPPPPRPAVVRWDQFAQAISNGSPIKPEEQAQASAELRTYLQSVIDHMKKNYPAETAPVIEAIEKNLVRLRDDNLGLIKYALRRDVLDAFENLSAMGIDEATNIYKLLDAKVQGHRTSLNPPPPPPPAPAVDEDAKTTQLRKEEVRLPSWSQIPDAPTVPLAPPLPKPLPPLAINSPREMAEAVAKYNGGEVTVLFNAIKSYFKTFRPEIQADLDKTLSEIDQKLFTTVESLREEIDRRLRKMIYEGRLIGYRELDQVEAEYVGV